MKTKRNLKNILSSITLVLVVISCIKRRKTEDTPETDTKEKLAISIKSFVFTKEGNSIPANPTAATEVYKALFIKKTPADTYATLGTEFNAIIQRDSLIKVVVPFNTRLNMSNATLKSKVTFKQKPGLSIYIGENTAPLAPDATSLDYFITLKLLHSDLKKKQGITHILKLSRKDKYSNVIAEKLYKIVLIHSIPSDDCSITKFAIRKADINAKNANNNVNSKIRSDASGFTDGALLLNPEQNTIDKGRTNVEPIEYKFTKTTHVDTGFTITDGNVLKVDAMVLPNGATILTEGVHSSKTGANPITTGIRIVNANADQSIDFKVVAQDGKTEKFYRFTYKAT
ncbi:hypothetical protein [Ichthyobacterium seriolicida]|uniref:Lipoprotein n=1 Tax=Ichthyobacterium seriolicida TaxID=242600 RepID=A0A1J1EBS4_9FLAO|nr:hypothetical protein [Ichthyobacterium seriolicida]BAV95387.1 hypothetical protein JBKA6_1374 [Ichthyobacterium seriolicida]